MPHPREGMLRPEFQDWYPTVEAGRWFRAEELMQWVLDHFRQGSPQWRPEGRIPSDRHFAFRGGAAREGPNVYTRAGDPPRPRSDERTDHSPQLDS